MRRKKAFSRDRTHKPIIYPSKLKLKMHVLAY
jgi:hypothetical protein